MEKFKPEDSLSETLSLPQIRALPNGFIYDKVVLGIDIYKYSQYPSIEQIYIPVIFEKLYSDAVYNVRTYEKYFFENYCNTTAEFKKKFISTGDGGFQIFDNEVQAIIFAIYFQTLLKRYNTVGGISNILKNLHKIVDSIDLRFAISRDKVYSYKSNFFGPAIITNSRILSKDTLNRLLIDANSINWLNKTINSPENLMDIDKTSLAKTTFFKSYDTDLKTFLFDSKGKITALDVQKIGKIKAKENDLDIFNMHVQAKGNLKVGHQGYSTYVITLGNLNTSGIS